MEVLPFFWAFDSVYHRTMYGPDWNIDFENIRVLWMNITSWQALTNAIRSKFFKPLTYFPPVLLISSYLFQISNKIGVDVAFTSRMLFTGISYKCYILSLFLIYFLRPAVISAKFDFMQGKWNPVDRVALVRIWGYAALRDDVIVEKIKQEHLPYIRENEREVLSTLIGQSGRNYLYYGLRLSGTELIRELAVAAAKARGGKVNESFNPDRNWNVINGKTGIVFYNNAPTLYSCNVFSNDWREVPDFSDQRDIGLHLYVTGRNMVAPETKINIVSEFVHGIDELFEQDSVDGSMNVLAQNASCKRPATRIWLWIMLTVAAYFILIATNMQFYFAILRLF